MHRIDYIFYYLLEQSVSDILTTEYILIVKLYLFECDM